MNISEKRPTSLTENSTDINNFISYLKGEKEIQGEITIPQSVYNSIANKIKTLCPIRSLAKISTTSGDKLDIVVDNNESELYGWVKNELIKDDVKLSASKISIYLHELFAKPKVASSLLEDHLSKVEEFLNEKITTQMAAAENKAFLYGDGSFQPRGILTYEISTDGPASGKIEGINAGENKKIENSKVLVDLMELMPSKYLSGSSWIMSRNTASQIRTLRDESTGKFMWQNSIALGIPDTLLGYPVVICDDMPKISNEESNHAPILFANLYEGYQIAEKQNINIMKDPYNSKPFIEFYATKRVGGDVTNFNAIKALVFKSS